MKNKSTLLVVAVLTIAINSLAQDTSSFTDSRNGKTYKTVVIGNQTWMAENLAFRPDDGSTLIYNDDKANQQLYGCLYDWKTAIKACPAGWHLPTDAEYKALISFLGGPLVAGGKLKEAGVDHWKSPNTDANNSSGFTALPGGGASDSYDKVSSYAIGTNGYWWCSQEKGADEAMYFGMSFNKSSTIYYSTSKSSYFSVRCVKD